MPERSAAAVTSSMRSSFPLVSWPPPFPATSRAQSSALTRSSSARIAGSSAAGTSGMRAGSARRRARLGCSAADDIEPHEERSGLGGRGAELVEGRRRIAARREEPFAEEIEPAAEKAPAQATLEVPEREWTGPPFPEEVVSEDGEAESA